MKFAMQQTEHGCWVMIDLKNVFRRKSSEGLSRQSAAEIVGQMSLREVVDQSNPNSSILAFLKPAIFSFCSFFSMTLIASSSGQMNITSIEARDSGLHDLYFTAAVPGEGCQLTDRAAIDENSIGAKTMLSVALTAFTSGKKVVVEVNGCTTNRPKIIRLQVFN